jgi:hypothetical protein
MNVEREPVLSDDESRLLAEVCGTMIPASREFGMPGADDSSILADIVKSVGRDLLLVRQALAALAEKAGDGLGRLDRDRREALVNDWYSSGGAPAAALGRLLASAYYRDDRVLVALGHEARPPFPKGHVVEQGDWSLLETVKARPPLWRDDRKEKR